jgi:AcrR family transcriptional regulator
MTNVKWNMARDAQHFSKREAIIIAAQKCFAAKGFSDTTLSDVAGRLNITIQALYYYFKNKNELMIACATAGQVWSRGCIDQADHDGDNGLNKLKMLVGFFIRRAASEGAYVVQRLPYEEALKEEGGMVYEESELQERRLLGFVKEGIRDGSIRDCDAFATYMQFFGALNWTHLWTWRSSREYTIDELVVLYEEMADRMWEPCTKT